MSNTKNGVHILVFPFPAQGHMLPLLDLTEQISLRGLAITILTTPKNLQIFNPLLLANPSIQTLVLPFPPHPSILPGVENVKDTGIQGVVPIMAALSSLQGSIIEWFESHSNPPVAILSDSFLGWTQDLASKIGIPRVVFHCSGAFLTAVFDQIWDNPEAVKPGSEFKFENLPGQPGFAWYQLPSLFQRCRESESSDSAFIKASMAANSLSWASVSNTFDTLEHEFSEFSRRNARNPRFYKVGPLNLMAKGSYKLKINDEKSSSSEVISWLDQWEEDGSVLYVCFGSQKMLKKAQVEALAEGLARINARFIWVVRQLTSHQLADGYGSVPHGFEDRVSRRGLVIKGWAPQRTILSHRAVGGFLSHCGWNSVTEAITFGVMILGWPMEADQFVNAKLLVEYKGAAVLVCQGADTVPDSAELALKISEAMGEDVVERARAKELKNKALEAVKDGGTSKRDLDRLVQVLAELKLKNVEDNTIQA